MSDQAELRVEKRVGRLLQIGVAASLAVLVTSMVVGLSQHMGNPRVPGLYQHQPASAWARDLGRGKGAAIAMLGLAILIATPLVRVVFTGVSFALRRDWAMVVITAIVAATLVGSFALGVTHS